MVATGLQLLFLHFEDCLEMLKEKATYETPQEEESLQFLFTSATINSDNSDIDSDYESASFTSSDVDDEIAVQCPNG